MNRRAFIAGFGSAAAWPVVVRGQQQGLPIVAYLTIGSPNDDNPRIGPLLSGLNEAGLINGRDFVLEYHSAAEPEGLRVPTADLLRRRAAVIFGPPAALLAARATTRTTPIVFATMGDPVADGFVTSLNRPGGNLTGVRMRAGEEPTKLLELLHELVPAATVIGMLIYPANLSERDGVAVEAAARTLGLKVALARATTESELTAALASFAQAKANALLINDSRFFDAHTHQLVELATRERWPAVSNNREFALAGGVASYGASIDGAIRQAGVYIGRILKGAQPAGLPVLQPTKFELVINLKAAKALGVEIQPQLLARADEVIE